MIRALFAIAALALAGCPQPPPPDPSLREIAVQLQNLSDQYAAQSACE